MDKMVKQLESDQVKFIISTYGSWLTDDCDTSLLCLPRGTTCQFHFVDYGVFFKSGIGNNFGDTVYRYQRVLQKG